MADLTTTAPARIATRLAFFAAGFAVSVWAPLIPYAKAHAGVDAAQFGLLLLALGIGSLTVMPITGWVSARSGARPMILLGGFGLAVVLPFLALAGQPALLGGVLFLFGGALGTLDVSMNVHGSELETIEDRPLMSGFHAQFSLGGFAGSGAMTGLLSLGLGPLPSVVFCAALTALCMVLAAPRLLRARGGTAGTFALPHGIVVLIALLTAIAFLVEGALLDWGALLMIDRSLFEAQSAGLGYMVFSIAMVIGRLTGDRMVAALGSFRILVFGGAAMIFGLIGLVLAPKAGLALAGFALVGLGAANIVPVLFSLAGRQKFMPAGVAIAAVTTTGYAGVLLGPALLGFAAQQTSLPTAFWLLVVLTAAMPLAARTVVPATPDGETRSDA